jgi:hypothetical protein
VHIFKIALCMLEKRIFGHKGRLGAKSLRQGVVSVEIPRRIVDRVLSPRGYLHVPTNWGLIFGDQVSGVKSYVKILI